MYFNDSGSSDTSSLSKGPVICPSQISHALERIETLLQQQRCSICTAQSRRHTLRLQFSSTSPLWCHGRIPGRSVSCRVPYCGCMFDLEDKLRGQRSPLLLGMSQSADQKDGFFGHVRSIILDNDCYSTEKDHFWKRGMATNNMPGQLRSMAQKCHATTSQNLPLWPTNILSRWSAFERGD